MKKRRVSAKKARSILGFMTICGNEACFAVYHASRKRCPFCGAKKTTSHVCTCEQCDCGEPY